MGRLTQTGLLGAVIISLLIIASCGDDSPTSPQLVGEPPESLAGVWQVTVQSSACYPFARKWDEDEFTDTICVGEIDFNSLNSSASWDMYLHYDGILEGRWTEPVFESSWGEFKSDSIVVHADGRASATLEECDFTIKIHTRGSWDGEQWTIIRSIERFEAEDCGRRPGDTLRVCRTYYSTLRRIGDAPQDCSGSNSVVGW